MNATSFSTNTLEDSCLFSLPRVNKLTAWAFRRTPCMDGGGNAIAVWAGTTLATPVATATLLAGDSWTPSKTLVTQGGGIGLATNRHIHRAGVSWWTSGDISTGRHARRAFRRRCARSKSNHEVKRCPIPSRLN